jgi:hypothetical protein
LSFKLSVVNTALGLTGNNIAAVEEDGSAEWTVGSVAYDSGLRHLLGSHDWKFATVIQTLSRVGDADDGNYEDSYAKPANTLGLIWVRVDGFNTDWRVVGNRVYATSGGGTVTAKIVREPDPEEFSPLFVRALELLTKAGVYEGLNEDAASAARARAEAEMLIAEARSRSDREEAPRAMFRSRILRRRRGELVR